jgi:Skp family chaperone for outer membrane proteins
MTAQEAHSVKIAVFLPDRIISNSVRGHKIFSELEVMRKNLEEKIQAKGLEGQKIQSQIQSPSISEGGKEQLTKQLRDLEYEFKKLQEDSEADYRKVQQKVFAQFQTEIGPVVQELAKEQKLQLVLQNQQGLIAYGEEPWLMNFTNEVAKRYDAKYESGAPATAKPAAPAKGTGKSAPKS